jgi:fucose permease
VYGTSFTIVGATLPKVLANFHWSYLAAGAVISCDAAAYFMATFVAGYLVKHWGPKPTILVGLASITTGLSFFATSSQPLNNALLLALVGLGQGCVEVGVNWSTLRIDEDHTGRPMSLMHGAFAVGAILGPLGVGLLMRGGFGWTSIYRCMALVFVMVAVLIAFAVLPPVQETAEQHEEKPERLSANPAYWLSFFALLLYVGVELGFSNWVAEYFVAVFAYTPEAGATIVSLFWVGLLIGRFGVPLIYKGSRVDLMVTGLSALATVAIILLTVLGDSGQVGTANNIGRCLVFLAGLGCSIYYPSVITMLGKCFSNAQSQAIGFAATGGGIGAFLFPFLMSWIAQHWGMRTGFVTYGVFAVGMTIVAGWLGSRAVRG